MPGFNVKPPKPEVFSDFHGHFAAVLAALRGSKCICKNLFDTQTTWFHRIATQPSAEWNRVNINRQTNDARQQRYAAVQKKEREHADDESVGATGKRDRPSTVTDAENTPILADRLAKRTRIDHPPASVTSTVPQSLTTRQVEAFAHGSVPYDTSRNRANATDHRLDYQLHPSLKPSAAPETLHPNFEGTAYPFEDRFRQQSVLFDPQTHTGASAEANGHNANHTDPAPPMLLAYHQPVNYEAGSPSAGGLIPSQSSRDIADAHPLAMPAEISQPASYPSQTSDDGHNARSESSKIRTDQPRKGGTSKGI